ncbi:hypothetical protein [Wenxinia saemankumensis]|uniref:Uncharacterized protein n=1 Tax=Wenxinia saemankumensis TaxID=1447782 RepID=A0A1M6DRD7_9RHOB|nr:hypothetical protein [Wenxinia saemankumensis]SHI75755.1 hypothetical protein SAMN05444417_1560 [Wenxinia saemankumensis]
MKKKPVDLYDLSGSKVAIVRDDIVYGIDGTSLGLLIAYLGTVIDFDGAYIGEVVEGNRLLRRVRARETRADYAERHRRILAIRGTTVDETARTDPIDELPGFADVRRALLSLAERKAA